MDDEQRLTVGGMAANGYFDPVPVPAHILAARGDRLVRIHTLLFDPDASIDDSDEFDDAAVYLVADILHTLDDSRRDTVVTRAKALFFHQREEYLIYDHSRGAHGPTGPWPDCPTCQTDA